MKNEEKVIFILMALVVVIGLFKKVNNTEAPDLNTKKIEANTAIDIAEKKVLENLSPDDKKDCECGGTGFIIHGDGHRTPCPAGDKCESKKRKTSQLFGTDDQQKNGIINFYTLPGCAPCLKWKKEIKPWVEASGWKVIETQSTQAAPWFEIWIKNKKYNYTGFMSKQAFKEIVLNATKK